MRLTPKQINRANTFHRFLKRQTHEYFAEQRIFTCSFCRSTGLQVSKLSDGGFSWDTSSYCDECNGIGYKGLVGGKQVDLLHYICKRCDGIGCPKCDQTGIVDWVANVMG